MRRVQVLANTNDRKVYCKEMIQWVNDNVYSGTCSFKYKSIVNKQSDDMYVKIDMVVLEFTFLHDEDAIAFSLVFSDSIVNK